MPVAQPVVDEREDLACRGDPSDGPSAAFGDAMKSAMIFVGPR